MLTACRARTLPAQMKTSPQPPIFLGKLRSMGMGGQSKGHIQTIISPEAVRSVPFHIEETF